MNFVEYNFSLFKNPREGFFEFNCMPVSTISNNSFIKGNKAFANLFLLLNKWINLYKYLFKRVTNKSPYKLISMFNIFSFSINENNTSSNTTNEPFKNWCLSIVKSKYSLISIIDRIFTIISLDRKTAFSINKSSEIIKLIQTNLFRWNDIVKELFFSFYDKISFMLLNFHLFYKRVSCFLIFCIHEFNKYISFCSFLDKKFINTTDEIKHRVAFYTNVILRFPFFITRPFRVLADVTIKMLFKYIYNTYVCSRDYYLFSVFESFDIFMKHFSNIKTSVSVKISSYISKYIHFFHVLIMHEEHTKVNKVTDMDTPSEMALSDIQTVTDTLMSNDAMFISDSVEGANKFGTAPVSAAYLGLGHADLGSTLSNMDDFINTIQYPSQASVKTAEYGAVDKVRFFLSSRGSKILMASGDGETVYNTFICGMEAYANVSLDGYKSKFIYHDGRFDGPLELNQTAGWKMAEVPVLTNDSWIVNLKSTLA